MAIVLFHLLFQLLPQFLSHFLCCHLTVMVVLFSY